MKVKFLMRIIGRLITVPFVLIMFFVILISCILLSTKAVKKLETWAMDKADFLSSEGKYEY